MQLLSAPQADPISLMQGKYFEKMGLLFCQLNIRLPGAAKQIGLIHMPCHILCYKASDFLFHVLAQTFHIAAIAVNQLH